MLNYKPGEVFKQDFNFLMKLLLSVAKENTKKRVADERKALLEKAKRGR